MVPNTNYFSITSGNALNKGATLGSPYNGCINVAGLATPITRPQGAAYDIGAYEYVVSIVWGHDTNMVEGPLNFSTDWICSAGTCTITGSDDNEKILLSTGGYAYLTTCVSTHTVGITLDKNKYAEGSEGTTLYYRTAASSSACGEEDWSEYTGKFTFLGYVGICVTKGGTCPK